MVLVPLGGKLLDGGAGVEPHAEVPAELVQHVADADVLGLAEYPVTAFGEGYDLGVAAGRVEERRVGASGEGAADLDVGDAVVDPHDRETQRAGERPGGGRRDAQARPEARTHGERDQVYVRGLQTGPVQGCGYRPGGHLCVVVGRLAGVQPALRRTEHVDLVRQNVAVLVHYPDSQRVRGALDTQRQHLYRPPNPPHP